jgi:ribosome-associated protein
MSAGRPLRVGADLEIPADEIAVAYTRSGGPGGQNVNKVETCAVLRFSFASSRALREDQKERIRAALGSRITAAGEILVRADRHRERRRNEEDARERLAGLISRALAPRKPRRPSRPSRGAVERRLASKRRRSGVKQDRRAGGGEQER